MTPVQQRFVHWILEREKAREAKELGVPYKGDPIIEQFRFCNVNREHDTVTKWIANFVRPKLKGLPLADAVYQLYVCRVFNEPDCLEDIVPNIAPKTMLARLKMRRNAELKILRGAYLVVPHGVSTDVEVYYMNLAVRLHKELTKFLAIVPKNLTLAYVADAMLLHPGIGEFMANQVCTDLRYQPGWTQAWGDWDSFVLAGPGTRRGLARYGAGAQGATRQPNGKVRKLAGNCAPLLLQIRRDLRSHLPTKIFAMLRDINNLSNCFCEFDKYERAREGKAQLRRYTNGTDQS